MATTTDLRPLHRDALARADELVRTVRADDLDRPTPCAGWDLAALLAHMVGQHVGFAAALRHGDAPESAYEPRPFDLDGWTTSVDDLLAAAAAADLDAMVHQVELRADGTLPVSVLVAAQLLDTVVHTWDVARALGTDHEPSAELAAVVLRIAEGVGPSAFDGPNPAFAPSLDVSGDERSPWARALALVGRNVTAPVGGS